MFDSSFRLSYVECATALRARLSEPPPGRIQLLAGPRQVGKTTLLLEIAKEEGERAVYAALDAPEASLPGFWEHLGQRVEATAMREGRGVLLLDEAHLLHGWASRLKTLYDRLHRHGIPAHVVATGSSALRLAVGSRESLAGRFERLTLAHWSASSVARVFHLRPGAAAELLVRRGSYPGAFPLLDDEARWLAYVRDAIVEPAVGRDLLALAAVRRPALLRQVFGVAASCPAQIVSLQKIQGLLQDPGALETVAHYLSLLEEAFLVAAVPKYSGRGSRRRAAPPKLVTLNNALLAVMDPDRGARLPSDPAKRGAWIENACLAHAWNSGQRVSYWREEPLEVDGVLEGSWGDWALEVKTGRFEPSDLRGLLEFTRRHPRFTPLLVGEAEWAAAAGRSGVTAIPWAQFLLEGVPGK